MDWLIAWLLDIFAENILIVEWIGARNRKGVKAQGTYILTQLIGRFILGEYYKIKWHWIHIISARFHIHIRRGQMDEMR